MALRGKRFTRSRKSSQRRWRPSPAGRLGDIAILYRDFRAGDIVAEAVTQRGLDFVRVDNAAPYRKVALTSWIEDCAAWCAGGWREGRPQLRGLLDRWLGFHRTRISDAEARGEAQRLTQLLWLLRSDDGLARDFVAALRAGMLDELMAAEPSLADQREQVDRMSRHSPPAVRSLTSICRALVDGTGRRCTSIC